ncbi:MAG: hypothetical protein K1X83_15305 [Oligoflexia bacterium]|nr:hypothetical protein [Oligoflexia bacterium]
MKGSLTLICGVALAVLLQACSSGGGGGASCMGSADPTCVGSQYCRIEGGACGEDGNGGNCQETPAECPADIAPVCSCDGITFFNECLAAQAGQSVRSQGECPQ